MSPGRVDTVRTKEGRGGLAQRRYFFAFCASSSIAGTGMVLPASMRTAEVAYLLKMTAAYPHTPNLIASGPKTSS
jgi:hypothetical protein